MSEEVLNTSPEVQTGTEITSGDGKVDQSIPETTGGTVGAEGITPVQPAYNPNYKFSVMDKEHEVDEWARPLIKDPEMEKKVKELYTKAYGLDYTKQRATEMEGELGKYKESYTGLYKDVEEAVSLKNAGDLDGFFQKVGLSNDKIYDWILAKINRQNLPPEQKQVYEQLEAKNRAEREWEKQFTQLNTQYQTMAEKNREMEVDFALAKPDVQETVNRYDSLNGKGAFKRFVAEYGFLHHSQTGQDPTVEMAVSAVMKRIGGLIASPQAANIPTASGEKPLPVIPNVSGRNISPTRRSPRSLSDLKKLADEAQV